MQHDLTEPEVELINMLRGFTAEGADLRSPWTLDVRFDNGLWQVCDPAWKIDPLVGVIGVQN